MDLRFPQRTVQHFTHNHPLTQVYEEKEYLCGGCKTPGTGTSYQCRACDLVLHEYCATCPAQFSSFLHPVHLLNLFLRNPQATNQNDRISCDLCGEDIEGLFYRCQFCNFDLHPLCTQLPQFLHHVMHQDRPLTLQQGSSSGCCMVCKNACTSWRYRCKTCCVDLHVECVLAPCETSTLRSVALPGWTPPTVPPHQFDALNPYGYLFPYSPQPYLGSAYSFGHVPTPSVPAPAMPYFGFACTSSGVYPCGYGLSYNSQHPHLGNYCASQFPIPTGSCQYYVNGQNGGNSQTEIEDGGGGRFRKGKIIHVLAVTGKLALGLLSNIVFGFGPLFS